MVADAEAPLGRDGGESPYDVHHALQETMQDLVGIIRTEAELRRALDELDDARRAGREAGGVRRPRLQPGLEPGHRPARHAHGVAAWSPRGRSSDARAGAGTPARTSPPPDPEFGKVNLVQRIDADGAYSMAPEPLLVMPAELKALFEEDTH